MRHYYREITDVLNICCIITKKIKFYIRKSIKVKYVILMELTGACITLGIKSSSYILLI